MTFEKPWSKEFDQVLKQLESTWGGKIKRPGKSRENQDPRFVASDYFFYPTYHGQVDGLKISVSIGEISGGDMSIIAAGDNAEILDIRVYVKSDYSVKVSLEGGIERFKTIMTWLPTWSDARKILSSLGVSAEEVQDELIRSRALEDGSELLMLYRMIAQQLSKRSGSSPHSITNR